MLIFYISYNWWALLFQHYERIYLRTKCVWCVYKQYCLIVDNSWWLFFINCIHIYIKHLHPASWTAQTWKNLAVTISSIACVTITLPEIRCNTSPRPIGLSPEFLSNGTEQCARNAAKGDGRFSAFHNFLITSAKVL